MFVVSCNFCTRFSKFMSVLLKLFGVNSEEEFQSFMSVLGKLFSREYFHSFMSVGSRSDLHFLESPREDFRYLIIFCRHFQSFISVFLIIFIAPCPFRERSPKFYVIYSNDF